MSVMTYDLGFIEDKVDLLGWSGQKGRLREFQVVDKIIGKANAEVFHKISLFAS